MKHLVRPLVIEHDSRSQPAIVSSVDGVMPLRIWGHGSVSVHAPGRVHVQLAHRLRAQSDGHIVLLPVAEFDLELN